MIDDPMNTTKVKRGMSLPQSKLTDDDVMLIRELVCHREELKRQASELTNRHIADKFGVHHRTIERITAGGGWRHVQ